MSGNIIYINFINSYYSLNIEENQVFYYEAVNDYSWSDSLLVFKDGDNFCVIENDTETRVLPEDECLRLMVEFEEFLATIRS